MNEKPFQFGSRWLKADFHLHTRADQEFIYTGELDRYISDYVAALEEAKIGLGVITNHNKFDCEEFKALRKKARKSGIGLLPGIELSINGGLAGIHTLVVFSDAWITNCENKNYIQDFLGVTFSGRANFENENACSNHNMIETIRELDKFHKDYFLIFAHVEQEKGLWDGLKPGLIQDLFSHEHVKRRVLGFQKVCTRDERVKIKQVLGNDYPAEVEGCDAKNLADMATRKAKSYLKLGAFSFEAVKFALQDHQNRLCKELTQTHHSHIRTIRFEGAGSLGGTEIHLSPELNTFIGIRGSGKSSILEGIRYALNIPFGDKDLDVEYKIGLVKHFLHSGGKITIEAIDKRGQLYEIQRTFGDCSDVYVHGQLQPGVSIRETILHKPIYFGQKDLSSTGAGFEKDLIEKLVGEALGPVRQQIEQASLEVVDVINQIQRLKRTTEQKQEWAQKKQDAIFKLQFYQQHGVEEKLQKQIDFDRDERKANQIIQASRNYLNDLNAFIANFEDDLKNHSSYKSTYNSVFFDEFLATFKQLLNGVDSLKTIALQSEPVWQQLVQHVEQLQKQKQFLKEGFADIERKLAGELKQAGAQAISPQEFRQLKSMLDQADQMLAVLDKSEQQHTELSETLERVLIKLNDLWLHEYRTIEQVLGRINREDSPLKIFPEFKANKIAMLKHLQDTFRGSESKITKVKFKKLVDDYSDFGAIWRNKEKLQEVLKNDYSIFLQNFEENLHHLLNWQVPNCFTIKYHEKPLTHHSLGQRASALILFVLRQRDNDVIIIDQPEDDLDNQTIYNDVIKLIRELKPTTQFIFATHNANIPVLGDAEQVIACQYLDDKIETISGSIDCANVQKHIVSIMEGGAEAFEKRKQVYEAWKPQN